MSIIDKIRQVNPRQEKSVKFTPVTEGGLGLSRSPNNNDDIKKPKQNVQAEYWYDKYEELVKEVSYHRKMDRQNLTELEDKVVVINEGLLDEIASINNSDPLAPLEKKFVTLDKLAEHYKLFLSRIQEQIATIGGGGAVELTDLDDVDDSNRSHKSIIMYNDVTGKYEASDPDMNAGISNEDHSGDEIILNATDSSGTNEGGSIQQENKTATAVPSPTGDIVHTGNLETTGNASISGTLGVGTDGDGRTDFNGDVKFNGNTSGALWDYSTNDLILYDSTRLEFGSNKDFEIWHGGSHTFMKNSGGDLRIRGDVLKLAREDGSEFYLVANVNNEVTLYHNGNAKIATTSSGISVTGNVVISNDGNIGSVGDTDSIAIDSSGVVTFSQTPVFSSDLTISDDLNLLSDSAAIYFGADKDVFAFHVHNLGLSLKNTSTADDTPFVLTLQTGETDIAANDVLGRIQFQAPDEGTGSDAVAISAAIQARSEGDFSSSSNATSLDFLTGVSGTASTKMTLSSAGNLNITGETTHNDDVKFPGANYDILWDEATSKFKFDDDAQCVFGSASGGDMRLFHSGGNSTIKNETGQFRLAGNDIRIQTQNNSEDYILCTDGGAVTLYYNDNAKLATTNTGVTVTGDARVGTSQSAGVILTSPDSTEYRLIVANDGTLSTSAV